MVHRCVQDLHPRLYLVTLYNIIVVFSHRFVDLTPVIDLLLYIILNLHYLTVEDRNFHYGLKSGFKVSLVLLLNIDGDNLHFSIFPPLHPTLLFLLFHFLHSLHFLVNFMNCIPNLILLFLCCLLPIFRSPMCVFVPLLSFQIIGHIVNFLD